MTHPVSVQMRAYHVLYLRISIIQNYLESTCIYLSITAIVVTAFNLIESGVWPVEFTCTVVYSQTIRRPNFSIDQRLNVPAICVWTLDTRLAVIPIGPINSPEIPRSAILHTYSLEGTNLICWITVLHVKLTKYLGMGWREIIISVIDLKSSNRGLVGP